MDKDSAPEMNLALRWFRALILIGVVINMTFAIPALAMPGFLNSAIGLPMQAIYPWLNNTGMLLIGVSLFYLPAGFFPTRWPVYSWLTVLSRLIAAVFWYWLADNSGYPSAFIPLLLSDGSMFVLLAVTLQLGLPPEDRCGWNNFKRRLCTCVGAIRHCFAKPRVRIVSAIVAVLVLFIGYTAWDNLLRAHPDPVFKDPEEHFKYGAIGLGAQSRVPRYVFDVIPKICTEKGKKVGWADFGFVFEAGKELPIGMAERHIGFPTVEATCSLCHTGRYRKTVKDAPLPILAGPANTLDLERFQWFLYDCAESENFTPAKVLAAIEAERDLGLIESLYYRFVILPVTRLGLQRQAKQYAWQKIRPLQGPGRTDTFNPTKMVVFGFPDDSTIGTVDLPQIWNQKPRESMWLHWDGNNNQIKERNYAAAMAVGATPQSVLPDSFKRITDWLLTKQPDAYPYPIDKEKAARGAPLWNAQCADCHSFGKEKTGQVTTNIEELGTDRYRLDSFTIGLVDKFHTFKTPPFDFGAYRKTQSYSNTPTDGIWARAPYLHNGAVPTLWDLLTPPEQRPESFYIGYDVFDPAKVGFVSSGKEAEAAGWLLDTRLLGNGKGGHRYGTDLDDDEKWDLIEYMKTF